VELNDVLIGDVWLASGTPDLPPASIPESASPWIRVFGSGRWELAARSTLNGHAAAAWAFANSQHDEGKVPVGIIDGSYAAVTPYAVRGVIWNPSAGASSAYRGPVFESMAREGSAIRLRFHSAEGLAAKGEPLAGFTIAAEDRGFVAANAQIDRDAVLVSAPNIANPVAVRYGYLEYPAAGLCDRAGFPAAPFRIDAW
jgi:hypothetical protein